MPLSIQDIVPLGSAAAVVIVVKIFIDFIKEMQNKFYDTIRELTKEIQNLSKVQTTHTKETEKLHKVIDRYQNNIKEIYLHNLKIIKPDLYNEMVKKGILKEHND